MNSFERKLKIGKMGESAIANWLKLKGYSILPVYEKEISDGKGPQVFTASKNLIAPDLLVFGNNAKKVWWIEAKHKNAFSWWRKEERWVTGIDRRHYKDYLKVQELSPWPLWLMFLQRDGIAKNTPKGLISPNGLYGESIKWLSEHINHEHDNWAKGMVYWWEAKLQKIATLQEVLFSSSIIKMMRKQNLHPVDLCNTGFKPEDIMRANNNRVPSSSVECRAVLEILTKDFINNNLLI